MRILVVEDERRLAQALRRGMAEQGYAVDIAYDGEEGFELADSGPYDLVVLDVMLPDLDGYEVCRRLRARRRNVPILMLTARDAVEDRITGLDSGADDYLVKPFAFGELLARVRALLRRDGPSRNPVLRVADLEIDTRGHEVRRGGRPMELTSREYAILEYFAHNLNRVLTRTQIGEHVWNYDFVAMSNVVDVYVGRLRRKLEARGERQLLQTIRGTGYRLRSPPDEPSAR